jgi:hypothetical protein
MSGTVVTRAVLTFACSLLVASHGLPDVISAAATQPSHSTAAGDAGLPSTAAPQAGRSAAPAESSRTVAEPRIFLTSRAPYGQPGASDRLIGTCGDSSKMDTLYMCFDPGRDADHFNGVSATVYFWPAGRETLGAHWKFGNGQDYRGLKVRIDADSVPGTERAWERSAVSGSGYRSTPAAGRLSMIVATPAGQGPPVRAGVLYGFARLAVPRPAPGSGDCDRPICIEWAEAALAFKVGELVQASRGDRFVTWNSPDGKACGRMREFGAPKPWQPGRSKP